MSNVNFQTHMYLFRTFIVLANRQIDKFDHFGIFILRVSAAVCHHANRVTPHDMFTEQSITHPKRGEVGRGNGH